jgi:glycerol-3-phosphate acyltransferase PlsY
MHWGLVLAASYVVGAIPFGWILVRLRRGVDVRTLGSGNIGATNVGRVLGPAGFAVVLLLDAAKGALPVLLLAPLAGLESPGLEGAGLERLRAGCGLAAVVGHMFPVFLAFRGGKGVATGAGVAAALLPLACAAAAGAFAVVLLAFRYLSLASMAAAVTLAPFAWLFGANAEIVVLAVVVGALVIVRHRANLGRIAAGTEPRAFSRKEAQGA